jgi:hypothetical protein
MYQNLGIHWASMVPAFLALACVPFPFLFYKYGPKIRSKCKYAAEAEGFLKKMQARYSQDDDETTGEGETSDADTAVATPHDEEEKVEMEKEGQEEREEEEQEAIDYSYEQQRPVDGSRFEQIKTGQRRPSIGKRGTSYDGNPFDLDRVNTRESFRNERRSEESRVRRASRASSRASRR